MHNYEQKILMRLRDEMGISEEKAHVLYGDILALDDKLKLIFDKWLENPKCVDDYEARGFSIKGMMEKYKLTFVSAILTMDWIEKEPDVAVKAIKSRFFN